MKRPILTGINDEIIRYIEHIEKALPNDGLTGTRKKEFFLKEMGKIISTAFRDGKSVAAGIVDIDNFKEEVNDRYGHLKGDAVISMVAGNGIKTIRYGDIIGRYGGDEFSLGFPYTEEKLAKEVVERWRRKQEEEPLLISDGKLTVKITGGVSDLNSTPEINYIRGGRGKGREDVIKSFYDHGKSEKTKNYVQKFLEKLNLKYDSEKALNALERLSDCAHDFLQQNKMTGNIIDHIRDPDFRWEFAAYMLLGSADKALYEAKKRRNVIVARSEF